MSNQPTGTSTPTPNPDIPHIGGAPSPASSGEQRDRQGGVQQDGQGGGEPSSERQSGAQQEAQPSASSEQGEAQSSSGRKPPAVLAYVGGKAITELPTDLYIPPDALEIFLETFEGPLDLLLYLIRRQNMDILEIDVAAITDQYMAYVEMMRANQFELAGEYLVMAAMLAEIKSRMLLPREEEAEEDEEDPRMQLIRRLQEYERFKEAAESIDRLPRMERDLHPAAAGLPKIERITPEPVVELDEVLKALARVLHRADMFSHHHIQFETLSTREKMAEILSLTPSEKFIPLLSLLSAKEGRLGVVVTFLALMELLKDSMIEIVQSESFGPIHLKSRSRAR